MLGLLLDFRIRHETGNRRSLDTVMRSLYENYYRELGRGWTAGEFQRTCEEIAGTSLSDYFEYAATTKPIDFGRYLAYAGLELEPARPLPDRLQAAILASWAAVTVKESGAGADNSVDLRAYRTCSEIITLRPRAGANWNCSR